MISEIVEAKPYHCGQMARMMRKEHLAALKKVEKNVHSDLRLAFDQSAFRRALLIDGKLAAMGGISGTLLSPVGYGWVTITEEASRYPLLLVKVFKRMLAEAMSTHLEIGTTIIGDDDAARRLAVFLGFHCDHNGEGQPAFGKKDRERLNRYLKSEESLRVPIGGSYVVPLGYHY